jgi:hypothetical protein
VPRLLGSKSTAPRLCPTCGYKLAGGRDEACPMCARFEQLRTEFAVPRPSELASLRTHDNESPDANQPPVSFDRSPTASEYRAAFAAQRARAASAGRASAGVLRTRELRQPASRRTESPTTPPVGDPSAPPDGLSGAPSGPLASSETRNASGEPVVPRAQSYAAPSSSSAPAERRATGRTNETQTPRARDSSAPAPRRATRPKKKAQTQRARDSSAPAPKRASRPKKKAQTPRASSSSAQQKAYTVPGVAPPKEATHPLPIPPPGMAPRAPTGQLSAQASPVVPSTAPASTPRKTPAGRPTLEGGSSPSAPVEAFLAHRPAPTTTRSVQQARDIAGLLRLGTAVLIVVMGAAIGALVAVLLSLP